MIQTQDSRLKPCPHCNAISIFADQIDFLNGVDEGYHIGCNCGRSALLLNKWYSNKNKLIVDWNDRILDASFEEIKDE